MKTMKQIVVAVSLVVISAMAPVVEAQQGVEKAAQGMLVAPAETLNSLLNMTESQMMVKAFPAGKYAFAPRAAIFATGQQIEYGRPHFRGIGHSRRASELHFGSAPERTKARY